MTDFAPASSTIELTAEEKKVFGQLFQAADTQNLGVITGELAVKFFEKSGLKPQTLGEIWGIADTENRGLLTKVGFSIALRLIGQAQNGQAPRPELAQRPGPLPTFQGIVVAYPNSPQIPQAAPTSPIQPQLSGTAVKVPRLTPEDVAKYTELFERSGAVDGVMAGEQARNIFQKAKLPNSTLGVIWQLADRQQKGALQQAEFVVAMHLIQCTVNGSLPSLPNILPPQVFDAASGRLARPGIPEGRQRPTSGGTGARPPVPMAPIQKQFSGGMQPARTHSPLARQFTPPPQPPPVQAPNEVPWIITPQEKAKFDAHFADVDVGNKGYITGEEAVPFFSGSKLPEDALAQIWDLADIHKTGSLTREEFAVAMYLIRNERIKGTNGKGLPETLPINLIPIAMRPSQIGLGPRTAGLTQSPQQPSVPSAFDIPAPPPPPSQSKSNYDDLFGLQESFTPQSTGPQPTSPSSQPASLASGFGAFQGASDPFAASKSLFSSTTKPFQPSSSFGQSIVTPTMTGGSTASANQARMTSPTPSSHVDDLLGDNDPEVSKKLTAESTELANLSNQIGSLTKQTQDLKNKRASADQELTTVSNQKHDIELRLAQLRQMYEQEEKDVKRVEERLAITRNETARLKTDFAVIEANVKDLRAKKADMTAAYEADQRENMALKDGMRTVNAEIATLNKELEKLKSDARQQKGLVAISKKQLATAEAERDKIKSDMEAERRELAAATASPPVDIGRMASPQPPASPTLSQTSTMSNTNPFHNPFHRSRPAPSEPAVGGSPFASGAQSPPVNNAFENVFGSSFSSGGPSSMAGPPPPTSFSRQNTGGANPPPMTSFSRQNTGGANPPPMTSFSRQNTGGAIPPPPLTSFSRQNTGGNKESVAGTAFSTTTGSERGTAAASTPPTSPPMSSYSPQPAEIPPAPAVGSQITSAFLPLPIARTDSVTSSVQVQPPSESNLSRPDTPQNWGTSSLTMEGDTFGESKEPTTPASRPHPLSQSATSAATAGAMDPPERSEPKILEKSFTGSTTASNMASVKLEKRDSFSGFASATSPNLPGSFPGVDINSPIMPTATGESHMSTVSNRSRGSQSKGAGNAFGSDSQPNPFNFGKDEGRAPQASKEDFDAAFASFASPTRPHQERTSSGVGSIKREQEFPPIEEVHVDDSSDSENDAGGFDDNFTDESPKLQQATVAKVSTEQPTTVTTLSPVSGPSNDALSAQLPQQSGPGTPLPGPNAQASPPPYDPPHHGPPGSADANPFPPEFTNLLPARGDPTTAGKPQETQGQGAAMFMSSPSSTPKPPKSPPPTGQGSGSLLSQSVSNTADFDDMFASDHSKPSQQQPQQQQLQQPAQISLAPLSPATNDDDFEASFVDLSDAKEVDLKGDSLDEFGHSEAFDEFNPVFDSPGPSKASTMAASVTQGGTSMGENDFDDFNFNTGGQMHMQQQHTGGAQSLNQPTAQDWDAIFGPSTKNDHPEVPSKEPFSPQTGSPTLGRAQPSGAGGPTDPSAVGGGAGSGGGGGGSGTGHELSY